MTDTIVFHGQTIDKGTKSNPLDLTVDNVLDAGHGG